MNLLTRKFRVPVPSMRQLDKARRFSSEFEQQQWGDIFRVPYMANPGVPKTDETTGGRARSAGLLEALYGVQFYDLLLTVIVSKC